MAAKRSAGSRKPARNPVVSDDRLDDLRFYWSRLTDIQKDRLYNVVAKLAESNEAQAGVRDEDMPRVVLYDPRTKTMR
jgi:hypothetical protein